MNTCKCGCGTEVKRTWVAGHQKRKTVNDYLVTESGCWEWQGHRANTGYGVCDPRIMGVPELCKKPRPNGQYRESTHVVFYVLYNGPIPDELLVRHTCDNPPCVNPEHLILGTHKDNTQDMMNRGRHNPVPRLTKCAQGHDLTDPTNVYVYPNGTKRQCRTCRAAWSTKESARRKAERARK